MNSDLIPPEYVTHLGRQGFVLQSVLGRGLSGSVFLAEQRSLSRKVAVKFFDSAFVRNDSAMHKRFIREAKLLARFQHPNIPFVLTEGEVVAAHGPAPYYVMEYVQGKTLRDVIAEKGKLEPREAIDIAVQILNALAYAHARKIIHRDVKPANIMVDERQRCFLIDFSIGVSFESAAGVTRATKTGEILGSPPYTSPEQLRDAGSVDGRTDIYGAGMILVEMLTGRTDLVNIGRALSATQRNIVECIERACATDLAKRFGSAEDFARSIGGGRKYVMPALSPSLAICVNHKCADADWTERGYYRGPRVIEQSTGSYCTSCGSALLYRCRNCDEPIAEKTPFCGYCGAEIFHVPRCKVCGSWLLVGDMDSLGEKGCAKCGGKKLGGKSSSIVELDDDIPF